MTIIVPYCSNDYIGPELRSVFPQPPAFILETTILLSDLQLPLRFTCSNILFRVKNGEMFANNFALFIPFDAPCAEIPCCNVAFSVQHENGMV